jgi:hypothetical protein
VLCGAAGIAGALPAPVQAALADASRAVGVDVLPHPQRESTEPSDTDRRSRNRPAAPSHPQRGAAGRAVTPSAHRSTPSDDASGSEPRAVAPPDEDATVWAPLPSEDSEPPTASEDEVQQSSEEEHVAPDEEAESWPDEAEEASPNDGP